MVFQYGSGELVPGFDARSPMRNAFQQAGDNFIGSFAALFVILITLLTWALVALLVVWLLSKVRRRYAPATTAAEPVADANWTGRFAAAALAG